MANLRKWFKDRADDVQGAYHQANVFDGGRTYNTNNRGVAPAPSAQQKAQASIDDANRKIQSSSRYGVLADQNTRDNFTSEQAKNNDFNTAQAAVSSAIKATTSLPKTIAKPFWEVGDTVKAGAQLGVANVTRNQQAADNARQNRDQSFQESAVAPVMRAYRGVEATPLGSIIPGVQAKKNAEAQLERKMKEIESRTNALTDTKTREIAQGIKDGKYDPQKGNEAIQQLIEFSKAPTELLGQMQNKKLESAGFDKNMSAARMYAQSFGDLASTAGYVINPVSGKALAAMPLKQALKTGTTEVATNSLLGGAGMGATAYGQGASIPEAIKQFGIGTGMSTLLMGGGYLAGGGKKVTTNLVSEARKTGLVRPSVLNDMEVADLNLFRQQSGTGALSDSGVYQRGIAAADKAGIDYRDGGAIDDLLGSHMTYASRQAEKPTLQANSKLLSEKAKRPATLQETTDGYSSRPVTESATPQSYSGNGRQSTSPSSVPTGNQKFDSELAAGYAKLDKLDELTDETARLANRTERAAKAYKQGGLPTSNEGDFVKAIDKPLAEKQSVIDKITKPFKDEGGYVKLPGGKNDPAPDLNPQQKEFINGYAEMLEGMGSGNGVDFTPDGRRVSNNYRDPSLGKGNVTKQQWFDKAREEIESGKAAYGASDDYKLLGDTAKPKKADPEADLNKGLGELSNIRKQYANDQEFFDKVILENQEAPGKIGEFARHIARRDATEGSTYNKNYLTEILDDELAPTNTQLDQAINKSAQREDLVRSIRDLEKSTGQKGLYNKVSQEMKGMTEQEQIDYMSKAMTNMRDNGVLAMDYINRQSAKSPFETNLEKAGLKPTGTKALRKDTPKVQNQTNPRTLPNEQAGTLSSKQQAAPGQPSTSPSSSVDDLDASKNLPKAKKQQPESQVKRSQVSPEEVSSKTRGFIKSVLEDPKTNPKVKESISSLYTVRNTKELQTKAATLVKEHPDIAEQIAKDAKDDTSIAVTMELIKKHQNSGDYTRAIDLVESVSKDLTDAGRTVQAASIYGRLTPEGILRFTQKEINNYNKATGKDIKLTPKVADKLQKMSESIQKMPEGYDKDIAVAELVAEVQKTMPSTIAEKASTFQTMAQLLNPKTIIRNEVGNTAFLGLENISQTLSTPVDTLLGLFTGKRTTTLPSAKAQLGGLKEGRIRGTTEAFRGINTGANTQYDLNSVPVFRGKVMGGLEKTMGAALRGGDRANYTAAFDDSLKGAMKLAKVKTATPEMLEAAHHAGLYRTFQDQNVISNFFVGMKKTLNKVGIGTEGKRFGLGDVVLKYPKTPANLLARGIDYSPAGFVKTVFEASKPLFGKEFSQKAFVDSFGRATTGTAGLVGTGAILGSLGIITESPEKDKDLRDLQKQSGLGGYQVNVSALKRFVASGFNKDAAKLREGDSLVSYDWAQPAAIPVSMGAAIGKGKGIKEGAGKSANAVVEGVNTITEQPMVRGLQQFFGSNKGAMGVVTDLVKDAPASFIPTASNQVRQLTDNTTRNTYDPNAGKEMLNKVRNKIPVLSKGVTPKVGSLGDERENYQNGTNNPLNVFLNPAFISKYQPKDTAKLPLDIFNRSGETQQAPRSIDTTQKVNGKDIKITSKQNEDLQRYIGEKTNTVYDQLSKDPKFMALSDVDKAKKMSGVITDITKAGKIVILGDEGYGTDDYKYSKLDKGVKEVLNDKISVSTKVKTGSVELPENISQDSRKILESHAELDEDKKNKIAYEQQDYDYKLAKAQFEEDSLKGKISKAEMINRKAALKKAEVGTKYTKDTREYYDSLSKDEVYDLVTSDPNGQKVLDNILAYGDSLVNAGVSDKNKFRDKYGNLSLKPKGKKGSGSKRKAVPSGLISKAVSTPKVGKVRQSTIRAKKVASRSASTRRKAIPKINKNPTKLVVRKTNRA
jgi:hypothetical protein